MFSVDAIKSEHSELAQMVDHTQQFMDLEVSFLDATCTSTRNSFDRLLLRTAAVKEKWDVLKELVASINTSGMFEKAAKSSDQRRTNLAYLSILYRLDLGESSLAQLVSSNAQLLTMLECERVAAATLRADRKSKQTQWNVQLGLLETENKSLLMSTREFRSKFQVDAAKFHNKALPERREGRYMNLNRTPFEEELMSALKREIVKMHTESDDLQSRSLQAEKFALEFARKLPSELQERCSSLKSSREHRRLVNPSVLLSVVDLSEVEDIADEYHSPTTNDAAASEAPYLHRIERHVARFKSQLHTPNVPITLLHVATHTLSVDTSRMPQRVRKHASAQPRQSVAELLLSRPDVDHELLLVNQQASEARVAAAHEHLVKESARAMDAIRSSFDGLKTLQL